MKLSKEEIVKSLECCRYGGRCSECAGFEIPNCQALVNENAISLINELAENNERLNKEVDRLSQVVLYNDGVMVDIIREFSQRARDQLRTGNMLMDKSISDIVYQIEDEMLEEYR
jgi:hypothetical protein